MPVMKKQSLPIAKKVRSGLYLLVGITHTDVFYGGRTECDGQIFAESFKRVGQGWETFCEKCLECDSCGPETLMECREIARERWMKD
jgi:hypothetical protein